jgi:hypothetical protein
MIEFESNPTSYQLSPKIKFICLGDHQLYDAITVRETTTKLIYISADIGSDIGGEI